MSQVVECSCGARFRAKDELAGKSLPCPKCGQVLTIPAAAPMAAAAVAVASVAPAKPAPMRPPASGSGRTIYPGRGAQPPKESPRVAISLRSVIYIALFIIVPVAIWLIKIGPVAAMSKWHAEESNIESDMADIVNRFLVTIAEKDGVTFERARDVPHLTNLI